MGGIDRAVAYTVLGRAWSVLAGPVTLIFLARFLSPTEQGFYFTFGSILSLQIFFELGLSAVILQFASHERARLDWTSEGTLAGDRVAKARLASLLRRALTWYGVMAGAFVAGVLPAGLFFFSRSQQADLAVMWKLPWMWVVVVAACLLLTSPLFALLEGCGLVAEIALLRTYQAIVGNVLFWLALAGGFKLFAAPILATTGLLWGALWLTLRKRHMLSDLIRFRHETVEIDWWGEVWSFQWRIALSGVSGYFTFLFFTPVLFAFHGAAIAGQMGMSMSVMTSLFNTATAWVGTKTAPFGTLIARREFAQLDRLFFRSLWQSLAVIVLGGAGFWAVASYLHVINHPLSQRILAPLPLGLLVIATVLVSVVAGQAIYLRAHKQEPFLPISILLGCSVGLSSYFLGKHFAATGMMFGYLFLYLILGLGAGTWIFAQKRRLWHSDAKTEAGAETGMLAIEANRH